MSIKVFHIPPRFRGSTETLLKAAVEKIKDSDYSKILYIAPTPRKVRDSQRIFHTLTRGYYVPPAMMTIKQLSKRLYSLYGDKKVIPLRLIPIVISQISGRGTGFASLIRDFISEIKQYHPGKEVDSIKNELQGIFHELGIPEEVSIRAMDAIKVFRAYQETLEKAMIIDEDDVMVECPELIKKHGYELDLLILDGFYELTRSEEAILKALIEHSRDTIISIVNDINYDDITTTYKIFINNYFRFEEVHLPTEEKTVEPFYYPYPGMEEEVEGIARNIKNYFISGKVKDLEKIIITFPKLYEYSDMVERVFRRYGIPYTLSTSKPSGKSRPFLDLLALLESIADDYPKLPFSRFLTSPYFKKIPSELREWIPTLSLRSDIMKGKDAWITLVRTIKDEQSALSAHVNAIEKQLHWIFKKCASLESIKDKGTFSQYGESFLKFLRELDFAGLTDQEEDIKEQAEEVIKELSLVDRLLPQASCSPPCTLRQFIDSLMHILNATETEIEGTGVQVMGFLELRGIEIGYLYFGGLKEGGLPSKPDIDHILPDSVRTKYGLLNLKRHLFLQEFIFSRIIHSTKHLHLSHPVMEADKLFLPSPFLPWDRKREERVPGIFSQEEALLRKGRKPLASSLTEIGKLGDKYLRGKFGKHSFIRVTDIDAYRACPRKFFIEKILELEPPEIREYKIEATLLGTIAHEIMQFLLSKPFSNYGDFKTTTEDVIERILSEKSLDTYWKELIRDSFLSMLPDIYELERGLMEEHYSFMKGEVSVEGEILKGIKLKGKLDRVDKKAISVQSTTHGRSAFSDQETKNIVELIDYKTGTTDFRGAEILKKGAMLQLPIYAALMKSQGFTVERAGIYSLKDVSLSWIPGKNDLKSGPTLEDYLEASLKYLEDTVSKMRAGDFSALPLNEYTCVNCSERPYCPYIQKTGRS